MSTTDATDLALLMERIHRSEEARHPFTLRGAEEIALYATNKVRTIFIHAESSRMPFHREGGQLCLRLDRYERFIDLQVWCVMNGLDFDKHARDMGFPKPGESGNERIWGFPAPPDGRFKP